MDLLSIILSSVILIWTIYRKAQDKKYFECVTLALVGFALIVTPVYVYRSAHGMEITRFVRVLQLVTEMSIIPLAYMLFSSKIGRQWRSPATVILWLLTIYGLMPSWVILLDQDFSNVGSMAMEPFTFYFMKGGETLLSIFAADFATILQAVATMILFIPTVKTMRRYGLKFTKRTYFFLGWWLGCVLFALINSQLSHDQLLSFGGLLYFYCGFFFLTNSILVFMALGYDTDLVGTKKSPEDEKEASEAVKVDAFVEMCHRMAEDVRKIIEVDKVYLNPDFSTEDAISMVGTNRTYFSRMMQAEFGCKFTDLLNDERLKHARNLLVTTDKSIAEIAGESGFSGASYLSRRFSMKYGIAPSEYRKSHMENSNTEQP